MHSLPPSEDFSADTLRPEDFMLPNDETRGEFADLIDGFESFAEHDVNTVFSYNSPVEGEGTVRTNIRYSSELGPDGQSHSRGDVSVTLIGPENNDMLWYLPQDKADAIILKASHGDEEQERWLKEAAELSKVCDRDYGVRKDPALVAQSAHQLIDKAPEGSEIEYSQYQRVEKRLDDGTMILINVGTLPENEGLRDKEPIIAPGEQVINLTTPEGRTYIYAFKPPDNESLAITNDGEEAFNFIMSTAFAQAGVESKDTPLSGAQSVTEGKLREFNGQLRSALTKLQLQ